MLNRLKLRNFKSARDLEIPLAGLTVLAGLNGSGKSTVLQVVALLRQSLLSSHSTKLRRLHLRGPLVQLGSVTDVLSDRAAENNISILVDVDGRTSSWAADAISESDILNVTEDSVDPDSALTNASAGTFQFLQADRLAPKTHYDISDAINRDLGFLGIHGEFTPGYLADQGERLEVSSTRRCPLDDAALDSDLTTRIVATPRLYDQVNGWLQFLSPGVRLRSDQLSDTDLVSLRFSYASTEIAQDSRDRRPSNVGFGLTYSLPIIVALLSAPPGALLLLENPEAHLHPRGQVALGSLIARCAADGVQVIVETHSDHLLNGIRLAVRRKHISSSSVRLCNFTRDPTTGDTYIETPAVLDSGELTAWPSGFFDEWEKSLENLLK